MSLLSLSSSGQSAGQGHDPLGIEGTQPGGLMVECPTCPHTERNLPDEWQNAGPLQ